ncbi:MAG TPA: PorP/SprF family type IX secretion system membrane protein [Cytophagales bacterium]|nr:PorP/SprF family type IX secretion system membrane protein [Cytophagales bacterium]
MHFLQKIFLLLFLIVSIKGYSQDYHFSQFYASPLSLNPALTGNIKGDYRASALYRSQWSGLNSKFETSALGLEMNFRAGPKKRDLIGAGLYVYRDNLGDNIFIAQSIVASGAYHHALDVYKRHIISGGVQAGYVQKSVDPSKLIFADQFTDFEFVPGLGTGDAFVNNQISYITINAGAFYSFRVNPKIDFFTGISAFQVNNPKESFFVSSSGNKLNTRYTSYSGMNYKLNPVLTISPKILYMNQENSQDINIGGDVGYHLGLKKETTLYVGGWYRWADAAVVMAGANWKNYTVRFSYDATVSGLREIKNANNIKANPKTGAFEISLVMTGKLSRPVPDSFTIPCGIY